MSAENLVTADCVCAKVSAWPTTRMSSSSAKILRKPARKMACVSATITRTNWPWPASSPAPKFSSMPTGVVAIQFPCLCSLEMVLVNHHANAETPAIFKGTHHTSPAVDLHIGAGAYCLRRQHDGEIHNRPNGHIALHREQHAIGGNVFCKGGIGRTFRLHRSRKMQRKSRRALQIFILARSRLRLSPWCCAFRCHAS